MPNTKKSASFAMILMGQSRLADPAAFMAAFGRLCPELSVRDKNAAGLRDTPYLFEIGGHKTAMMFMNAPVPGSPHELLGENTWIMDDAEDAFLTQKAHLVVTVLNPPPEPVKADILLTNVAAAALLAQDGTAVIWSTPAISSVKVFLLSFKLLQAGKLPTLVWINFHIIPRKNEFSLITQGMERFGQMELEFVSEGPVTDVLKWAPEITAQLLKKGPFLKPGQNVGRSPDENFPISTAPWSLNPSKSALIIDMRSGSKPKGFLRRMFGR